MVARLVGIPLPAAYRAIAAVSAATGLSPLREIEWEDILPAGVKDALEREVPRALRQVAIRKIIEQDGTAQADVWALAPAGRENTICKGCPRSLDCVANNLSTPSKCAVGQGPMGSSLPVIPIEIDGDRVTVEADQPIGRHVIHAKDIDVGDRW